jgi:hypothetical protein
VVLKAFIIITFTSCLKDIALDRSSHFRAFKVGSLVNSFPCYLSTWKIPDGNAVCSVAKTKIAKKAQFCNWICPFELEGKTGISKLGANCAFQECDCP